MEDDREERRRHPRRAIRLPVSFWTGGARGYGLRWHFGEILDVSLSGARVGCGEAVDLECGALVQLVCLTENPRQLNAAPQAAFRLNGRVIWLDKSRNLMGIRHE